MEHKMLPCTHFPPTALNFGIAKPSKRVANICRQAIGSGECYWTQKVNLEELNTSPIHVKTQRATRMHVT